MRENSMNPIIEIQDLETRFEFSDRIIYAVNGLSLTIHPHEFLAIVGESGSGKSVSFLSVMRLIQTPPGRIRRGNILYNNNNLLSMSKTEIRKIRGKDIAMIFQDPMTSLNPVMRIGEQLGEVIRLHLNLNKAQARMRSINLLKIVGIPEPERCINNYPHQFSGGMRQRVMIAIALSCDPKVLIADEPTTSLDVTIQAQIANLVKGLQKELGMSIVWITHDLGVVASLADRVAVMYGGRIVELGSVDDIFENPRHPYTIGLLKSMPRLDLDVPDVLPEIPGSPPECDEFPVGCSFAERCDHARSKCYELTPPLVVTDIPTTSSACFFWEECIYAT
jgi:oligopeptide transport system ATP-binding protein